MYGHFLGNKVIWIAARTSTSFNVPSQAPVLSRMLARGQSGLVFFTLPGTCDELKEEVDHVRPSWNFSYSCFRAQLDELGNHLF